MLIPTISSISPLKGSLMGGTTITITGTGFPLSLHNSSVNVGHNLCRITSSSYNSIKCQTLPSNVPKALPVSVRLGKTESLCVLDVGCTFLYANEQTPRVDSVVPATLSGPSNLIRLYGSGFPTNISEVNVKIGNVLCRVMSSSQYAVECRVGAIIAGKHAIMVHVTSKGYALFDVGASRTIRGLTVVSSMAPTEGSVMGGTKITIKGSGFDPSQTRVRIGTKFCPTLLLTTSQIICRTLAHTAGSFEVSGHLL